MAEDLADYATQLYQEVLAVRDTEGVFHDDAFALHVTDLLSDAGEFEDVTVSQYTERGFAINAWAIDEDETTIHLVVSDFRNSAGIESLTATQTVTWFRRLTGFVQRSFDDLADRERLRDNASFAAPIADVEFDGFADQLQSLRLGFARSHAAGQVGNVGPNDVGPSSTTTRYRMIQSYALTCRPNPIGLGGFGAGTARSPLTAVNTRFNASS